MCIPLMLAGMTEPFYKYIRLFSFEKDAVRMGVILNVYFVPSRHDGRSDCWPSVPLSKDGDEVEISVSSDIATSDCSEIYSIPVNFG